MSDPEREQQGLQAKERDDAATSDDEEDDDAASPFDHPAFLPVLLWGLSAWFGYDGWINQDPEMLEHVSFNRYGFGVLVIAALWFSVQAFREVRADKQADGSAGE
jgi:hypothetical protein